MPDDLRTLAQAVEDTRETYLSATGDAWKPALAAYCNALGALSGALGGLCDDAREAAPAILAALNAADAQGYARAMGEVVERCESTVRDYVDGRRWDTRIMGMCDEAENIAEWASEQAGD